MAIELGLERIKSKDFWRAVLAEFVGCVLFLLCVTSVALGWGNSPQNISANNVEIGIGIGLAIASLAQAFGHVSGGHLNPAVSLGMIVGGRINVVQGVLYIVAQLLGGKNRLFCYSIVIAVASRIHCESILQLQSLYSLCIITTMLLVDLDLYFGQK